MYITKNIQVQDNQRLSYAVSKCFKLKNVYRG